jgi:hypothetical protein
VVLAACGAALALAGCGVLASTGSGAAPEPGTSSGAPHSYTVSARVTTVVINGGAGTITVTGTSGPAVTVSEQPYYSDSKKPPTARHVVSGSTLTLSYSCPAQLTCGVTYVVEVPSGVAIRASDREGAIDLASLAGPVTATTIAGVITATGLSSPSATFRSTAGAITAAFSGVPGSVSASTDAGPIALTLPSSAAYQVHAHTYIGTSSVTVRESATSSSVITASSDVGSVTINPS